MRYECYSYTIEEANQYFAVLFTAVLQKTNPLDEGKKKEEELCKMHDSSWIAVAGIDRNQAANIVPGCPIDSTNPICSCCKPRIVLFISIF